MRVKKKSDSDLIEATSVEEGAEVVVESAPVEAPVAESAPASDESASPAAEDAPAAGDEQEENIYEVMKGHMRRQKEELEAKNAALRQQRSQGVYGRPAPAAQAAAPVIEKVADLTDMVAVWAAVRRYLSTGARYLDSVLGHCCRMISVDRQTGEAKLLVPANQRGFTNERARLKIEEAIKAVTSLPVKLVVEFSEEEAKAAAERSNAGAGPTQVASRVPPEVVDAVKNQPVVKELMKKLDATVVNIETIGGNDAE